MPLDILARNSLSSEDCIFTTFYVHTCLSEKIKYPANLKKAKMFSTYYLNCRKSRLGKFCLRNPLFSMKNTVNKNIVTHATKKRVPMY